MKKSFVALLVVSLTGCASVQMPKGQEESREFVLSSNVQYQEAFRTVSKQMRACYRVIGLFGNGYDVQADIDTAGKVGRVELYSVGIGGAESPGESIFSRTVEIREDGNGSIVKTTGTTPKYVYSNHMSVKSWLAGSTSCGYKQE